MSWASDAHSWEADDSFPNGPSIDDKKAECEGTRTSTGLPLCGQVARALLYGCSDTAAKADQNFDVTQKLSLTMGEVLIYRQISFDTAHVVAQPNCPLKATCFEAAPYPYVDGSIRVTEFDEKPIARWLMLCPPSRRIILEVLGLHLDACHRPEVVQPFYAPGEGDLDLIFCPRLAPNLATALECKRVKIESVNIDQDKINKLQDVAGGVHQANKLYVRFAFFQTYLAIITEVEASGQAERNIPTRGIRSHTTPIRGDTRTPTFRQIVEFPGRAELHNSIGIIFIEIVQPSRLSIDRQATVRVCAYRRAEGRDQLDSVTNRVMEIMR